MSIDLEDIRKVVKDLECEKNEALCEKQDLCAEISNLNDELCQLQRINHKLCDDLECTESHMKQLKTETCTLEQCIRQKDQEICCLRKLSDEHEKLKAYACQTEKELDAANRANCKLEEQITELTRSIQEKDMCMRRLENKRQELEAELCDLDNTVKCLSDENESLKQELEECHCNLAKTTQEMECLNAKLKQCEVYKQKLQDQSCCLQSQLEQALDTLHKEKSCNAKLQTQLKCCQDDNYKLKMENTGLCEDNCELRKKVECCHKNLKKCQCDTERAQREVSQLRDCIEQFKQQVLTGIKFTPDSCSYVGRAKSLRSSTRSNYLPRKKSDCISSMALFPRREMKSGGHKLCCSTLSNMCNKTNRVRSRKCSNSSPYSKKYGGAKKCY